jgi:hypothetical protein
MPAPRSASRPGLALVAVVAAVAALALPRVAAATPLTADDVARLQRGELVRRTATLDVGGERYVGGVAYAVVQAPVREILDALLDPRAYVAILPLTAESQQIFARGPDRLVHIRHRTRFGSAEYTCLVRRESGRVVRFWMDPTRPHDVGDLFGYFRVEPWGRGRSLVTYAAAMHLDFGPVRLLFEDKIVAYALGTPALVRRYVESHRDPRVAGR